MSQTTPNSNNRPSAATLLWAGALAAIAGFLAVYWTLGPTDNAPTAEKTPAGPVQSAKGASPAIGHMAAFVYKKQPVTLPDISFVDANEQPVKLSDFAGQVTLLNLWATWCAPCVKELPALDHLQKALGGDDFQVVALSVDRKGVKAAGDFLAKNGIKNLKLYADPKSRASIPLRVIGMPTTLLLNRKGREIGRLVGPAEWDSPDAKKLIKAAIGEE